MASRDKMWTLMMSDETNVDGISSSLPIGSFDTQPNTQLGSAKASKRAGKYTQRGAFNCVVLFSLDQDSYELDNS
jgi:hypothetical protein